MLWDGNVPRLHCSADLFRALHNGGKSLSRLVATASSPTTTITTAIATATATATATAIAIATNKQQTTMETRALRMQAYQEAS